MEKKQLSEIMVGCADELLKTMADEISRNYEVAIVKEPAKTLAMLKMRDPVKNSLFYLGETIVCEAVVEVEGTKGIAVMMGDQFDKVLNMAVIDAAFNANFPECRNFEPLLLEEEEKQLGQREKENAMYLKTMVNFSSMD